jgi:hypothetical protein
MCDQDADKNPDREIAEYRREHTGSRGLFIAATSHKGRSHNISTSIMN